MHKLIPLAVVLAVSGCAGSLQVGGLMLDKVRQMSAADLENATQKAMLAGDKSGAWCWQYLMAVPSPQGATFGIASAIEDARILAMAKAGPCSGIVQPLLGFAGGF